jgi:hypothetical protein
VSGSADRSRLSEAFDELSSYRDDGENVMDNLELVADYHSVPVHKLREVAERLWGSPLETDRERNAEHFERATRRNQKRAEAHAYRNEVLRNAKDAAIDVWISCSPNGAPDWAYCAKRFISMNKIEDGGMRQEISDMFLMIGKDFEKAVSLYGKWAR